MSGHSPRSSERKRSKRSSIFTGSIAVMERALADALFAAEPRPWTRISPLRQNRTMSWTIRKYARSSFSMRASSFSSCACAAGGQRPEATRAPPTSGGGDTRRRLARRSGRSGKRVAEVGQREVEPPGEVRGVPGASGRSAKRARPLGRALQVPLAVRVKKPPARSTVVWRSRRSASKSPLSPSAAVADAVRGDGGGAGAHGRGRRAPGSPAPRRGAVALSST